MKSVRLLGLAAQAVVGDDERGAGLHELRQAFGGLLRDLDAIERVRGIGIRRRRRHVGLVLVTALAAGRLGADGRRRLSVTTLQRIERSRSVRAGRSEDVGAERRVGLGDRHRHVDDRIAEAELGDEAARLGVDEDRDRKVLARLDGVGGASGCLRVGDRLLGVLDRIDGGAARLLGGCRVGGGRLDDIGLLVDERLCRSDGLREVEDLRLLGISSSAPSSRPRRIELATSIFFTLSRMWSAKLLLGVVRLACRLARLIREPVLLVARLAQIVLGGARSLGCRLRLVDRGGLGRFRGGDGGCELLALPGALGSGLLARA